MAEQILLLRFRYESKPRPSPHSTAAFSFLFLFIDARFLDWRYLIYSMGSSTLVEQWVEYGIGMVVFFLRFFARYKVVGIGGFAYDDLFAFIAMVSAI